MLAAVQRPISPACITVAMDHPLWNSFVVEMVYLLAKDKIFKQDRSARPGLELILIVSDRQPLVSGQRGVGPPSIPM